LKKKADLQKTQDEPAWRKLEIICADIERQMAPNATVVHDDRITGKSGTKRKIDISIRQQLGSYPVLIIVDCKRHTRRVSRKDIAAFQEQIEDVGARFGVMISDSGFASGALEVASEKRIVLREYREAESTDWQAMFGPDSWTSFTNVTVANDSAKIYVGENFIELPTTTLVFDAEHNELGLIRQLWFDTWKSPDFPRVIGKIDFVISGKECQLFLENHETKELLPVDRIEVVANLTAHKYIYNLSLGGGSVVSDVASGEIVFSETYSQSVDWKSVIESEDGVELTSEEYVADMSAASITFTIPQDTMKFIRLAITKKPTPTDSTDKV